MKNSGGLCHFAVQVGLSKIDWTSVRGLVLLKGWHENRTGQTNLELQGVPSSRFPGGDAQPFHEEARA